MLWVKCSWLFSFPKSSSGSDHSRSHMGPYAGGSLNLSSCGSKGGFKTRPRSDRKTPGPLGPTEPAH